MSRFERHARTVTLVTFASRVTGLARDASISRVFGAGGLTDAFFFAFMVPNLFRRLFGEGALSAAFLPVYTRLDADDPVAARRLATLTIGALLAGLGAITIVAELLLLAFSARGGHANTALWLMMITLPYMPLVCVVAILGAMLQVHGRFGPTAAAPIVLNACLIAATIGGVHLVSGADTGAPDARLRHVGVVAASLVVAGVLQVIWSCLALRGRRWWAPGATAAWTHLRAVLGQAGPMILGLGVLQVNTLFDGLIASYPEVVGPTILGRPYPLAEGAMSAVSYAQRLYQFPLGVFGIAVATAIFPTLARLATDEAGFRETVRRGLRLVMFIGLPASAGLIIVREPLTAAIFQGRAFTEDDTARVGFVLLGYAPAVWAYSMMHVLTRAFYARGDAATPVRVAVGVVGLNVVLNVTLIWTPLREAGLAWSTAICAAVQCLLLVALMRRRIGPVVDGAVTRSWMRTLAVVVVMTAVVALLARALPGDDPRWAAATLRLVVLVSAGAGVFVLAAGGLRMPELAWALGRTGTR